MTEFQEQTTLIILLDIDDLFEHISAFYNDGGVAEEENEGEIE
jgi:hypothetical protein